jgi:hypothetical protein
LANSKNQNTFLSPILAMFHHDCPLMVKPISTPWRLLLKQTWRDSLPTDMLLSAVSISAVVLPSLEVPGGRMNYPVYILTWTVLSILSSCIMNIHVQSDTLSPHIFVLTI